jgi:hypothetical protein
MRDGSSGRQAACKGEGWFKQIAYGTHAECTCEEFNIKTAAATFRIVLDEDRA